MNDDRKYASQYVFSVRELEQCPLPPSRMFLEREALMVAELARMAHMDGRRFRGWPSFTLATDYGLGPSSLYREVILLRAEVTTT